MEHGTVTSVNYEDGAVYCNVEAIRVDNEYTEVPVMKTHSGFIQIPEEGMTVAMDSLKDGTRFITHVISKESKNPDSMRPGEMAIQLDGETKIQFSQNGSGTYDLTLTASGDVTIDGIDFDEHTHDYDWTDTGGSSTTDKPQ